MLAKPTKSQIAETRKLMRAAHKKFGSWPAVSRATGINQTTCNRIARDKSYFPKSPDILRLLGIRPMGQAPICPTCGIVHSAPCPERPRRRKYKDLLEIPKNELLQMLENREEF